MKGQKITIPSNIPLLELRKRKRRFYLMALIAGNLATALAWISGATNNTLTTGDNYIFPVTFYGLIILILLTLHGKRLDVVEIGLFALISIPILASFGEAMLLDPINMVDLADLLYWFAFVYLLGFMVLKPPGDWMVLSIFLILTILTGVMHFAIHDPSIGNNEEAAFIARFLLAQISLFAVIFSVLRLNEGNIRLKAAGDAWEQLALTDSLTQISNRMALSDELDRELAQVQRYQRVSSILMMDIDDFKKINDNYGHTAGDKVLIAVAGAIRHVLREGDFLARFGGDEFVVILPETGEAAAQHVAARIRAHVATLKVNRVNVGLSVSMGVSELDASMSKEDVFNKVDKRLYSAKKRS